MLRSLAAYAAATPSTWLEIGDGVDLYQGAAKLGRVSLYLGRNATGETRYFLRDSGGGRPRARILDLWPAKGRCLNLLECRSLAEPVQLPLRLPDASAQERSQCPTPKS